MKRPDVHAAAGERRGRRIAVVGSGIAGNACAFALAARHDVVLYEREPRPGGHSATATIDYDGTPVDVDTGFIVYNERNYPNLTALLAAIGVVTEASDMSFSVSADGGRREWSGDGLRGLFAQRSNLASPGFHGMLADIMRFNRLAPRDRASGALAGLSLGDYLARRRYGRRFVDDYLVPMGAAIWSTPAARMLAFPAECLVAFFENHRLMHLGRPVWRTVSGGSRRYVERLVGPLAGGLRLSTPVARIERQAGGVVVVDARGHRDSFDEVVVAAHSDQALAMLVDPSEDERAVLGAIGYRPNRVVLHRDPALMPKRPAAWASWNYLSSGSGGDRAVSVTYWMNRLQNLDRRRPLFVSLNPIAAPRPDSVFGSYLYDHPQFDAAALAAQRRLGAIQGARRIWFCGAWCGNGFHEDGLVAGLAVAEALGGAVPWRPLRPSPGDAAGATLREAAE